ncbi:MAG: hypothetical protein ABI120_25715 [Gemmatimonadaceae bacterium]
MATVYLAHDLKHNRSVALKVRKPELSAALGAERFQREITTTAKIDDFRLAVQPFKYPTGNVDLAMLAEGLADENVTGLLRFPWLRVRTRRADAAFELQDRLVQ